MRAVLLVAFAMLAAPHAVHGSCNVIPPAIQPFRSIAGAVDRPFAGPGDWVELSADGCGRPTGITDPPGELVVSVVFTPPGDGAPSVVILEPDDCTGPAATGRLASCR